MNAKTKKTKKVKTEKDDEVKALLHQMNEDVRNSILVVSVVINLFFFIGLLVLAVTHKYDVAVIHWIVNH